MGRDRKRSENKSKECWGVVTKILILILNLKSKRTRGVVIL